MNVFEMYEKHVRKDMIPKTENHDDKLFELDDDDEHTPDDTGTDDQHEHHQFKLSDEDRQALVNDIMKLLKPDEGTGGE